MSTWSSSAQTSGSDHSHPGKHCPACPFVCQPKFVWKSGACDPVSRWLPSPDLAAVETLSVSHLQPFWLSSPRNLLLRGRGPNKPYAIAVFDGGDTTNSNSKYTSVPAPGAALTNVWSDTDLETKLFVGFITTLYRDRKPLVP